MEVSVDEMNHHQLTTRAIRIILDKAGRRNLAAIPASFNQISDITIDKIVLYKVSSINIAVVINIKGIYVCTFEQRHSCVQQRTQAKKALGNARFYLYNLVGGGFQNPPLSLGT